MHPPSKTRSRALAAAALATILLATSCESVVYSEADTDRQQAGLPALDRSSILASSARATSSAGCAAGEPQPSAHPNATYDRETIAAAGELVGSAPLDPTITDPVDRNLAATEEILDGWPDNAAANPRWDDIGVGEVTCDDGRLYLTAAVTDRPTLPPTGRYSTSQYPFDALQVEEDVVYGSAPNNDAGHAGETVELQLDLYQPPATDTTSDRPAVILIHGGGYSSGDKAAQSQNAKTYARRGYVAISINYRLRDLDGESDPAYIDAATDAIDDGMESVRWLKSEANELRIDPDRIAMLGSSAGGGIALGTATLDDPTPGGDLAAYSPKIAAAMGGGATLIRGIRLDLVPFDPSDSPLMMIHFEDDTATGATDEDVLTTCEAMWAVGGTCDQVIRPGEGHGSPLRAGGPWWTPEIGPYLYEHLDLA